MRGRVTVIREAHNLEILVRIQAPQPRKEHFQCSTWQATRTVTGQNPPRWGILFYVSPVTSAASFTGTGYNEKVFYVYLLENKNDHSWYIGFSNDLKRRLTEHLEKKGGRTTKLKSGWGLIYYEAYREKADAIGRERFLKSGSGRKYLKKQLVCYLQNRQSCG